MPADVPAFNWLPAGMVMCLTHWGRDKMAAVTQTKFSNAFSWIQMYELSLKFHWSLFLRFQLTIFQHWFRYWLGAIQVTSHYLNQWWLAYWRIDASLGLNELRSSMCSPNCLWLLWCLITLVTWWYHSNWLMQSYCSNNYQTQSTKIASKGFVSF